MICVMGGSRPFKASARRMLLDALRSNGGGIRDGNCPKTARKFLVDAGLLQVKPGMAVTLAGDTLMTLTKSGQDAARQMA